MGTRWRWDQVPAVVQDSGGRPSQSGDRVRVRDERLLAGLGRRSAVGRRAARLLEGISRDQHPGLGEALAREIAIDVSVAPYSPPAPALLGHCTDQGWTVAAWEAVSTASSWSPLVASRSPRSWFDVSRCLVGSSSLSGLAHAVGLAVGDHQWNAKLQLTVTLSPGMAVPGLYVHPDYRRRLRRSPVRSDLDV